MKRVRNGILMPAACALAALTMAGCSHTMIDSPLAADSGKALVIGKIELVKNGTEVKLGNGFFASQATLSLVNTNSLTRKTVDVGPGGEFAWALEPGRYRLSGIGFMVRGERIDVAGNFAFDASTDNAATYIGTINLQTTFDSGYYGLSGVIDSYTVSNDCSRDCAGILSRMGMPADAATVALLQPDQQLVSSK